MPKPGFSSITLKKYVVDALEDHFWEYRAQYSALGVTSQSGLVAKIVFEYLRNNHGMGDVEIAPNVMDLMRRSGDIKEGRRVRRTRGRRRRAAGGGGAESWPDLP